MKPKHETPAGQGNADKPHRKLLSPGRPKWRAVMIGGLGLQAQSRAGLDEPTISEYAERMRAGDPFPPPVVFERRKKLFLADGFHRVEAARRLGHDSIKVKILEGGWQDALKFSLGANKSHGLRRTNSDKRRSVELALKHFGGWSDRRIAQLVGVSNNFVSDLRRQQVSSNDTCAGQVRMGKDGKSYTVPAQKPKASDGLIAVEAIVLREPRSEVMSDEEWGRAREANRNLYADAASKREARLEARRNKERWERICAPSLPEREPADGQLNEAQRLHGIAFEIISAIVSRLDREPRGAQLDLLVNIERWVNANKHRPSSSWIELKESEVSVKSAQQRGCNAPAEAPHTDPTSTHPFNK